VRGKLKWLFWFDGIVQRGSASFQERSNVLVFSIINLKGYLAECGQFPICVGHAQTIESARLDTLTAIRTTINMITSHKLFGGTVEDDNLERLGWTIFGAQVTARAFGGIKNQFATETVSYVWSLVRIQLRDRFLEE